MTSSPGLRRAIGTLALLPDSAELCISGRVLAVGGDRLRVVDESGGVEVELVAPVEIVAGDIVQVSGSWQAAGRRVRGARVTRLAVYEGAAPFPSPGGEFFRLHA